MFPKVKNVNVESLKNGSKLLVFWRNFSTKRGRVKESKRQRVKESKRGRDKETKGLRVKESKGLREEEKKGEGRKAIDHRPLTIDR